MKARIIFGENGKLDRYFIDGKQVSKKKFDKACPPKPVGQFAGNPLTGWPIYSNALKFHPKLREQGAELLAKRGVPTEIDSAGCPVLRDREHRRKVLKALGYHDRNCFDNG